MGILPIYPTNIWTINEMITHTHNDILQAASIYKSQYPILFEEIEKFSADELESLCKLIKEMSQDLIIATNMRVTGTIANNYSADRENNESPYSIGTADWIDNMITIIESDKRYKSDDMHRHAINYIMSALCDVTSRVSTLDMSYRVLTLRNQVGGNYPICTKVLYPGDSEFDMVDNGTSMDIAKVLIKCYNGNRYVSSHNPKYNDVWSLDDCSWYYKDHLKSIYTTLIDRIQKFVTDPGSNTPVKVTEAYQEFLSSNHPIHLEVMYFIGKRNLV